MSTNLFEYPNRFSLIDTDAVVTTDFYIREPIGFSDIKITLERSKDHGFDFEYSADEESYGFNRVKADGETYSGYTFLKEIYDTVGVDANVVMKFESYVSAAWVTMYEGNLDFSTFNLGDAVIEIKLRRINFDDKFRTRMETTVNFSTNISIDGVTIPYQTAFEVFCHGLNRDGECVIVNANDLLIYTENNHPSGMLSYFALYDCLKILSDSVEIEVEDNISKLWYRPESDLYTVVYYSPTGLDVTFNTVTNYIIPSKGAYYVWREYQLEGTCQTNDPIGGAKFYVKSAKYINGTLSSTNTLYSLTTIDDSVNVINVDISFLTAEITSYLDTDFVEYKILVEIRDINTGMNAAISFTDVVFTTHYYTSPTPNTIATCYKPFNAINHILRSICDNGDTLLVSDFLENDANNIVLTNGYKLRNFEDRNVIESFQTLFKKWLQPTFGLGMAVVDDDGFKVLIEPCSFFYKDVEIDYIDTVVDGTFKISHDKEYCFNEITVGYEKYPDSTIENKQRSILEFNTKHDIVTPIKTIKNKGTFVSAVAASGILIDNQRLLQFSETPNETGDNDDLLFCIDSIEYANYDVNAYFTAPNIIVLEKHYYDIRSNQSITITESASNNGTYTVDVVSIHLTDDDSFGGLKIVVEETTIVNEANNAINIDFTGSRRQAARNENFDTLDNVNDASTTYNAALNPKVMLINQSPLINSGFHPKDGASIVKTTFAKLNNAMEFKFDSAPSHSLVATSQTISMEGDLALTDLDSNNKLFTGNYIKFTTRMSFARILTIRDACLKEYGGSKDYGYIRVKDELGVDRKVYIVKMTYIAGNEKVEFEGREKYTA